MKKKLTLKQRRAINAQRANEYYHAHKEQVMINTMRSYAKRFGYKLVKIV